MLARIQVPALKQRLDAGDNLQLIDVRTTQEYAEAHIPGTYNLPMDQIEARLEDVNNHHPVVLICQSGKRAELTYALLTPFRGNLFLLEGGTSAWADAGLPVVRTSSARLPLMRQVQVAAGSLALLGAILAAIAHPLWILLSGFIGAGLLFAGVTGFCGMAILLSRLPWNQPHKRGTGTAPVSISCSK